MRLFRHSNRSISLSNNASHKFALQYTLSIYKSDSAYTFIPKNACSTLRFSVAKANGCIDNLEEVDWIHSNNQTFSITTEAAFKAKYKFVILRCPFSRLFSTYMDKMVNMDMQSWKYRNARRRSFHPHDLTFKTFLKDISVAPINTFDVHWKPQIDFLLYQTYDDIFCLENFQLAQITLKEKIDFDIYDTRSHLNHHISGAEQENSIEKPYEIPAVDLLVLKRSGRTPAAISMYNEELIDIVRKVYEKDIDLYMENFGLSPLMRNFIK